MPQGITHEEVAVVGKPLLDKFFQHTRFRLDPGKLS